jgi:hypothetical protein
MSAQPDLKSPTTEITSGKSAQLEFALIVPADSVATASWKLQS